MIYPSRFLLVALLSIPLVFAPALGAEQLALPYTDMIAPTVTHQPISESVVAGSSYKFKVRVTDNVGIRSVILFYRTMGSKTYRSIAMRSTTQTEDLYTVVLEAEVITAPGIEYYIQAQDLAGNTVLQGHSFSPLTAKITAPAVEMEAVTELTETPTPVLKNGLAQKSLLYKNKWLWIGAVALVAGAVAASSLGGDGGDADGETGEVTISW